jgi:hypothetical protein
MGEVIGDVKDEESFIVDDIVYFVVLYFISPTPSFSSWFI